MLNSSRFRLTFLGVLVWMVISIIQIASAEDFCAKTASDTLTSCNQGAESDYSLALAKCDNLTTAGKRKTCLSQAATDRQDDLQSCAEQYQVRQTACSRFGPAPYAPVIDPKNFVSQITNPYFPLTPGTTFVYEGQTTQGLSHTDFIVTNNTKVILGVTCVEVHDVVKLNGQVIEDTLDWFAQDKDGNVWYFGENTHELEAGLITTIDGSFIASVNKAKPGIIMKAKPAFGDFYRQEFDLANAEDFGDVTGLNEAVNVPYGSFNNCLKTTETTPLEPDLLEDKYYCPGVGNTLTIDRVTGERSELIQLN
jgi:hypothetical protein